MPNVPYRSVLLLLETLDLDFNYWSPAGPSSLTSNVQSFTLSLRTLKLMGDGELRILRALDLRAFGSSASVFLLHDEVFSRILPVLPPALELLMYKATPFHAYPSPRWDTHYWFNTPEVMERFVLARLEFGAHVGGISAWSYLAV